MTGWTSTVTPCVWRDPNLLMNPPTFPASWLPQLSTAEIAFLRKVADFAATEVAPHAEAWEKQEEIPRAAFMKAGKIGLLGVTAPRTLGGRGFGYAAYALAIRELARH